MSSTFGYARPADGAYIGYRIDGSGPIDIVSQTEWPGNIDIDWQAGFMSEWLDRLSSIGRLITHDHRGVGVSSRNIALPTLETRVSDLLCVLDAVEADRPLLVGYLGSGAVNVMAAAIRPDLARAIVWAEPMARVAWAPDYPWGNRWEELDVELAQMRHRGTDTYAQWFAEFEAAGGNPLSERMIAAVALQSRNACTPDVAADLAKIWYETDVRGVLDTVQTPTLLLVHEERSESVAQTEYIAGLMPAAEIRVMPGKAWAVEEQRAWIDEIRRFVGEELPTPALDTVLSTVLFTDIVDSTARQVALGDHAWKDLIEHHHSIVRDALGRWQGTENDTAGDGFYATFEGPARAIACALEVTKRVRDLGIEIRAGVHTGECEIVDGKHTGLAVSIGARVASTAGASQVMVSQTVKDLVAGSGFAFEDAGEHELKGVPDRWRLYRVAG
jgi:class 3 adenylate cyclase